MITLRQHIALDLIDCIFNLLDALIQLFGNLEHTLILVLRGKEAKRLVLSRFINWFYSLRSFVPTVCFCVDVFLSDLSAISILWVRWTLLVVVTVDELAAQFDALVFLHHFVLWTLKVIWNLNAKHECSVFVAKEGAVVGIGVHIRLLVVCYTFQSVQSHAY